MENKILESGKKTIEIEYKAIEKLWNSLDKSFVEAVKLILNCKGRVIVTGVGKSAAIGRKIAATLSSTGTPSFFVHAGDGGHGDLGMVVGNDVVIAISYSGESEEINMILPSLKRIGVKVIAITGFEKSTLGKFADIILNVNVDKEACPLGLAPTSSTTATLVMGDAIAVALINQKHFSENEFALYHPAGSLGKTLLVTVNDIMYKNDKIPLVKESALLSECLFEITSKMLGVTGIINKDNELIGIFTDGDLRRKISENPENINEPMKKIMSKNPKTISKDKLAAEALFLMNTKKITSLFVIDEKNKPCGIVHIHDILRLGIHNKK